MNCHACEAPTQKITKHRFFLWHTTKCCKCDWKAPDKQQALEAWLKAGVRLKIVNTTIAAATRAATQELVL